MYYCLIQAGVVKVASFVSKLWLGLVGPRWFSMGEDFSVVLIDRWICNAVSFKQQPPHSDSHHRMYFIKYYLDEYLMGDLFIDKTGKGYILFIHNFSMVSLFCTFS